MQECSSCKKEATHRIGVAGETFLSCTECADEMRTMRIEAI
jgi:hypothetical protein